MGTIIKQNFMVGEVGQENYSKFRLLQRANIAVAVSCHSYVNFCNGGGGAGSGGVATLLSGHK